MKRIQLQFSVAAGKRLIARGLASREDIREAAAEHTVVIITGTTNSYLAEELLSALGLEKNADGTSFDRRGFYRGIIRGGLYKGEVRQQAEDVVISGGERITGKTIYDAAPEMGAGDIIFKGANAVNLRDRQAGILIGNPQLGTIMPAVQASVGRQVRLIHPVGLEKRVECPLGELAVQTNGPDTAGLKFYPTPGEIYTELEAIRDLTGASAKLLASGGVDGMEGGIFLLAEGDSEALEKCRALEKELRAEPPYQV